MWFWVTIAYLLRNRDHAPDALAHRMLHRSDRSVIVAVVAVRMMQVSGNHEVDVVAVRHFGVPALRVMLVASGVVVARVLRRARGWVSATDADRMLVGVPRVNAVQVSVVQIVVWPSCSMAAWPHPAPCVWDERDVVCRPWFLLVHVRISG